MPCEHGPTENREGIALTPYLSKWGTRLVRAGLETGDWQTARRGWPMAKSFYRLEERQDRLKRMALLAARDGAQEESLLLWKQATNYNRRNLALVEAMIEVPGMRERLEEFYSELETAEPACRTPSRFREKLEVMGLR